MVNQQKVIEILRNIGETIEKEKLFLTELDNVIGDGDHGINLSRGFQEVEKKLDTLADKDIGTILKTVGMTLVSTVGGAPLEVIKQYIENQKTSQRQKGKMG